MFVPCMMMLMCSVKSVCRKETVKVIKKGFLTLIAITLRTHTHTYVQPSVLGLTSEGMFTRGRTRLEDESADVAREL